MTLITSAGVLSRLCISCLTIPLTHLLLPLLDIHPIAPCPVSCFVLSTAGPSFPLVSLPPPFHTAPHTSRASPSSFSNPRYHSRTSYTNPHVSGHARISPSRLHLVVVVVFVFVFVLSGFGFGCQALSIVYTLCDGHCISTSAYLDSGPS
ncbi:hypothetical protein V8D89_005032 [Ganoderma adspersum]